MSTIEVYDKKDRMFTVDYDIESGCPSRYSAAMGGMIEADPSEIVINDATIMVETKKKYKVLTLTPDKLYKYVSYDRLCSEIEDLEDYIND